MAKENQLPRTSELFKQYFDLDIANQDRCWVPHIVCNACEHRLYDWSKGKGHLSFGRPMISRDPTNHANNCYICLTNVFGFSKRIIKNVNYPTVDSVTLPIPYFDGTPVPLSPQQCAEHPDSCSEGEEDDEFLYEPSSCADPLYIPDARVPHIDTR